MLRIILLAALLFPACVDAWEPQCEIPCLGPVSGEFALDCDAVARNHELALRLIRENTNVSASCEVFSHVHVHYRLRPWGNGHQYGGYDYFNGVELAADGLSHAHELLHAWDTWHLAIGTAWHEGWTENGYTLTSQLFWASGEDLTP